MTGGWRGSSHRAGRLFREDGECKFAKLPKSSPNISKVFNKLPPLSSNVLRVHRTFSQCYLEPEIFLVAKKMNLANIWGIFDECFATICMRLFEEYLLTFSLNVR